MPHLKWKAKINGTPRLVNLQNRLACVLSVCFYSLCVFFGNISKYCKIFCSICFNEINSNNSIIDVTYSSSFMFMSFIRTMIKAFQNVEVVVLALKKKSGKTIGVRITIQVVFCIWEKNTGKWRRSQFLTSCVFPNFSLKVKTTSATCFITILD